MLSFAEPVRFIFSHSALREGWDNPNVFVICMLEAQRQHESRVDKRSGVACVWLLISVGDRMDHPAIVHQVNVLTVVASESYKDFVLGCRRTSATPYLTPTVADEAYFTGKVLKTETGDVAVTPHMAKQIYKYLSKNDYTRCHRSDYGQRTTRPRRKAPWRRCPGAEAHAEQVYRLIDSVFSDSQMFEIR